MENEVLDIRELGVEQTLIEIKKAARDDLYVELFYPRTIFGGSWIVEARFALTCFKVVSKSGFQNSAEDFLGCTKVRITDLLETLEISSNRNAQQIRLATEAWITAQPVSQREALRIELQLV